MLLLKLTMQYLNVGVWPSEENSKENIYCLVVYKYKTCTIYMSDENF